MNLSSATLNLRPCLFSISGTSPLTGQYSFSIFQPRSSMSDIFADISSDLRRFSSSSRISAGEGGVQLSSSMVFKWVE